MYKVIPDATSADRQLDYVENRISNHIKELEGLKGQLMKTIGPFKRRRIKDRISQIEKHLKYARIQEKVLTEYIFTKGK